MAVLFAPQHTEPLPDCINHRWLEATIFPIDLKGERSRASRFRIYSAAG